MIFWQMKGFLCSPLVVGLASDAAPGSSSVTRSPGASLAPTASAAGASTTLAASVAGALAAPASAVASPTTAGPLGLPSPLPSSIALSGAPPSVVASRASAAAVTVDPLSPCLARRACATPN